MRQEHWSDEHFEPERYELREPLPCRFDIQRREFVQILGAGILISTLARSISLGQRAPGRGSGTVSDRLHIGADGAITVLTSKVEVGQGSRTQIAMAAAEELRVPLRQVRLVMADTSLVPDDGGTAGSRTTPSTVPRVRQGCAAARKLLVDTAAAIWKVERASLVVRDGKVAGPSAGKVFTYADLARQPGELLRRDVDPDVSISPVSEWKVLGKSAPRVGAVDIVTGAHRYPSDIRRPGMLYGAVLRPPAYGATLTSIDLGPARAMEGVAALRDGDFVGVAAPTSLRAREARKAIAATARWEVPSQPPGERLYDYLKENVSAGGRGFRRRGGSRPRGDLKEGLAAAKKVLRETYHIAYIQHTPMETRAAVAEWKENRLTVWTGTQQPSRVQRELAGAFRLSAENVRVIVPDTGGGFGGKHTGETAVEAARLAREARRPVSLQWSREEEFTWAYFRPAGVIELTAGLDDRGSIIAWEQINYNSGSSAIGTPYDIPNTRSEFKYCRSPLRQGSYRALASTANVFARESFMDEAAAVSAADPLEFRRRKLTDERLRAVLEAAARRFDWARRRRASQDSGKNRGVGLACGTEKASYTAACVEIEVDRKTGRFRVVEVCQAFECGAIQNPANLKAQVEGCIVQGLGGALTEEIRFEGGKILNPDFDNYRVPRFRDVPRIETVLLDRPDLPSVGAGETPIVAVAPAIGNALHAATGVRIRSLPIRNGTFRTV